MRMQPSWRGILSPPFRCPPFIVKGGLSVRVDSTGNQTMQTAPDWVSVPVAAQMLGCTDVWVIRLIQNGTLEGFRLNGRAWAVSRKSVSKNLREYLDRDPMLSGRKRSKLG